MSDSVQSHRRQPTRLPHPWDSPGKNTGVGYHFLLQCMKVKSESEVAQSCPTIRHPMDGSLQGSSIHGIFQARVLEWGAIAFMEFSRPDYWSGQPFPFSRDSSQPRDQTQVSCIAGGFFTNWAIRETHLPYTYSWPFPQFNLQDLKGFKSVCLYPAWEKAMATHSRTLAWKIPWMEEPGRLQSMESLRVGHDWATSLSLFTFMHWRRKWQLTPVFLPGESQGWGSLVGCRLWGRTESDTIAAT